MPQIITTESVNKAKLTSYLLQQEKTWIWQGLSRVLEGEYLQNFGFCLHGVRWFHPRPETKLIWAAQNLLKKVLISKLLFGKWAVCSGEQPLIFNKFICRNFLKQLVELFFCFTALSFSGKVFLEQRTISCWHRWSADLCKSCGHRWSQFSPP